MYQIAIHTYKYNIKQIHAKIVFTVAYITSQCMSVTREMCASKS